MVRVHVGLHLENKAAGSFFVRGDHARRGLARKSIRRPARQAGKQFSDTKILQRAAEDHRREMALAECSGIEARQVAQAQLQAFQRGLRDAVLDSGTWIKRLDALQLLRAAE